MVSCVQSQNYFFTGTSIWHIIESSTCLPAATRRVRLLRLSEAANSHSVWVNVCFPTLLQFNICSIRAPPKLCRMDGLFIILHLPLRREARLSLAPFIYTILVRSLGSNPFEPRVVKCFCLTRPHLVGEWGFISTNTSKAVMLSPPRPPVFIKSGEKHSSRRSSMICDKEVSPPRDAKADSAYQGPFSWFIPRVFSHGPSSKGSVFKIFQYCSLSPCLMARVSEASFYLGRVK